MYKKILLGLAFACFLFVGSQALAAGFGLQDTAQKAGYETTGAAASITSRVQMIVQAILGFVALIFFALTLYGGFIWLTARGQEQKVAEAKAILEAAAIGLVIISASYAITTFILSRINADHVCYCTDMNTCISATDEQQCAASGCSWQTGSTCPNK